LGSWRKLYCDGGVEVLGYVGFGLQKVQLRAVVVEQVAVQSKISLLGMIMIFCKKDENRLKNGSRKLLRE
jgi:hypothetical protein